MALFESTLLVDLSTTAAEMNNPANQVVRFRSRVPLHFVPDR